MAATLAPLHSTVQNPAASPSSGRSRQHARGDTAAGLGLAASWDGAIPPAGAQRRDHHPRAKAVTAKWAFLEVVAHLPDPREDDRRHPRDRKHRFAVEPLPCPFTDGVWTVGRLPPFSAVSSDVTNGALCQGRREPAFAARLQNRLVSINLTSTSRERSWKDSPQHSAPELWGLQTRPQRPRSTRSSVGNRRVGGGHRRLPSSLPPQAEQP